MQTAQLSEDSTTLLLTASDKIMLIPTAGAICQLQQRSDFETDTEEIRLNSLAIADINSDNTADIVMTDRLGHHIEVVTLDSNNRLVHATRFKVFEEFQASSDDYRQAGDSAEPRAVTLADVTGDGRNDVIVLVHDRIIVYPQD